MVGFGLFGFKFLPIFLLALHCFVGFGSVAQLLPEAEVLALKAIATKLHIDFWNVSQSSCGGGLNKTVVAKRIFSNVTCDCSQSNGTVCHIATIQLKGMNLSGTIPDDFANLTLLHELDFNRNYLNGSIPSSLSKLPLVILTLLGNRLSGSIPSEIGNIATLEYLNLENNLLSGPLPPSLGNLSRLDRLLLSANNFNGTIPETFGNLKNLTDFRVDGSVISGKIPDFIGNWTKIVRLDMQGTAMHGPIPSSISLLKNMTELRISDLSGSSTFPNLEKVTNMLRLILRNCSIPGSIPPYIGALTSLKLLDLSFNKLTGAIPGTLQNLDALDYMFLTNNSLTGAIPDWIIYSKHNMDVSYNNFTKSPPSGCQTSLVNLVSSHSSSASNSVGWCMRKGLPCSREPKYHSLFINCGGDRTSFEGNNYEADTATGEPSTFFASAEQWAFSSTGIYTDNDQANFRATNTFSPNMTGTDLYKTARLAPLSLKYYGLCMLKGSYKVRLYFAEIMYSDDQTFSSIGRRIFDVSIQGDVVLKDFNIVDRAGGAGKGMVEEFDNIFVNGSTLEIQLYWPAKSVELIACQATPARRFPMKILSSVLFSLFFLHALSLSPDGLSLLSLKSAIDQPSAFSDWNEDDATPCRWSGISCMNITGFPDPRVVGIAISGKNLRGYLPSELGTLVFLRRLNLHNNNLYGSIPAQLFNATSLHSLFLYGNNLSGSLPPSICNLPRLQNLDLSNNSLSGQITKDFSKCSQLQRLMLARNHFSGEIPTGIWPAMANLVQLDISSNSFNGSIPDDIGELKSLSGTLNLSFNHLSGEIPRSLGDLPVPVSFDLRHNNLTGEIPQTGAFSNQGPTAFLNNPHLCGFPLQKSCGDRNSDQSSPGGQNSTPNSGYSSRKALSPGLILLISVADAAGVALIGMIIVYIYWKKKDSDGCSCYLKEKLGGGGEKSRPCSCFCINGAKENDSELEDSEKAESGKGEGELVAIDKGFSFELDELLRASAYVLGKSGLGIVYKVVLGNGIPVAVRRLGEGGDQRYREFAAEMQTIGRVKHPNVVKLRAYYWASDEKLLISDFINNGNLASALCGRDGQPSSSLSWPTRLRIAKGSARGLAYLHECSPRKFVHGDIKPSNILIDSEFHPYISDFGLSKLINITGNNPSSGGFIGGALPYLPPVQTERTNNYKAPEAKVPGSRPTQKWDVYSFGVVLLELLTGKAPELSPTSSTSVEVPDLVRWVRKGFEEELPLSDLVDPMLLQEVHAKKEVIAAFHVAIACTESDPEMRPRMKTVSENLDKIGS